MVVYWIRGTARSRYSWRHTGRRTKVIGQNETKIEAITETLSWTSFMTQPSLWHFMRASCIYCRHGDGADDSVVNTHGNVKPEACPVVTLATTCFRTVYGECPSLITTGRWARQSGVWLTDRAFSWTYFWTEWHISFTFLHLSLFCVFVQKSVTATFTLKCSCKQTFVFELYFIS